MFVAVGLNAVDPTHQEFFERDVVSFHVTDSIDGDSARGDFAGHMTGIVRPFFPWKTELLK
jgi:lipopolysaccharide transport system ATP-binding protein